MPRLRTLIRASLWLTASLVAVVAVFLVLSQTPWFKERLRRLAMRQAERVLEGQLVIGRLEGTLFTGVTLHDVSVVQAGAPVVAIDRVRVNYGIGDILSDGRVIAKVEVQRPIVQLVRTPTGWNVARLLKPRPPSDPDKPRATFALPDIVVRDGVVTVEERDVPRTEALPRRIEGLQFAGSVFSVPEYLRVDIGELAMRADDPAVALESLTGRVTNVREGWHLQDVAIQTDESDVRVDGSITHASPDDPWVYDLAVRSGRLSLPEIGRFVPAVAPYELHPSLDVALEGPRSALAMRVDVHTVAGNARGMLTLDTTGPVRLEGDLEVDGVNLEPFLHDPDAAGRITGNAVFNLRFPSETQGQRVDGTFAFRGPEASAYGYEARAVRASGRLSGRRIELDAEASAYGGRATTRGHLVRAGGGQRELTLDLAGRVDNVDLRALPQQLPVPDLETQISGTYAVSGPLSTIQASGTLDTSQIEGAQVASGTVGSFARLPDGFTFDADGTVAGLDLQRLGRALDVAEMQAERFESDVSGRFVVRGARHGDEPLHIDAEGTLVDTVALGGRLPHLDVTATLSGRVLDVRALGSVAGYDLPTLTGVEALTGTITGTVDTTVRFRDLDDVAIDTIDVDGRFVLDAPTLLDVPFSRVEGDVRLSDGVVDVRSLTGTGDDFTLTGQGPLALGERGTSDFRYRLAADSLVNPARVADLPLVGSGTAEGTITGPRADFRVDGTFEGASIAYGDIVSAAAAKASYVVALPDLDTSRLGVTSDVAAEAVDVAGLTLEQATGRVGYVPGQLTYDVVATDGVRRATAEGTLDLEDAGQVVRLTTLSLYRDDVRWTLAPGAAAVITVGETRVHVEPLRLVSGAQQIDVAGSIALADTATNDLRLEASSVDLAQALHLADEDHDVHGRLRLEAVVGGTRTLPTARAALEVDAGRFRNLDIERVEASVDFDGRQAQVDALVRQSTQAYLTAKGVVPRWLFEPTPDTGADPPAGERLDVAVRSTAIDLALAEAVTTHVRDVDGLVQLDLRVTNDGRRPVADGSIRIDRGSFLVPYTGVTYRNLETSILLQGDHLRIERLSLETRDGSPLVVTGQLGLQREEPQEVTLNVKGNRFRVMNNAWGQAEVDVDLQVRGTLVAPALEGDVTVTSGRLELDQILARFATGAYATEADYQGIPTRTDPDAPPVVPNIMGDGPVSPFTIERREDSMAGALYEELALNVRVRIPDNLLLRGRNVEFGRNAIGDVNVTMGGDFRVVKTSEDPVVLIGTVNTVRGTYAYQGRRFDIARDGQVIFRGEPSNTPDIDITAERVIQGVEARVRIQGPADEPTLALSSNPPLDEADVLALIVFNQPVNQLGTGQQNTLAQRAGGVAAGFVVSPIAQALGDTLDLDLFDVETTDQTGRVNPAVVIGQQITPDLFVKFRQQFGNQQVSQFLLEYRLADFLRVQSSFAEGEGLSRAQRSLAQRIERYGMDVVFYFAF